MPHPLGKRSAGGSVGADVIELAAGALVAADGIPLESRGAQANEALLTGET